MILAALGYVPYIVAAVVTFEAKWISGVSFRTFQVFLQVMARTSPSANTNKVHAMIIPSEECIVDVEQWFYAIRKHCAQL